MSVLIGSGSSGGGGEDEWSDYGKKITMLAYPTEQEGTIEHAFTIGTGRRGRRTRYTEVRGAWNVLAKVQLSNDLHAFALG
jgi:hypothetical protein